jgi:hypothetical protein
MLRVKTYLQAAQIGFQLWRTFTPWYIKGKENHAKQQLLISPKIITALPLSIIITNIILYMKKLFKL